MPANRITAILSEQRGITADTALRLAQFFGSTPDFWMSLQSSYDVKKARESVGSKIEKKRKAQRIVGRLTALPDFVEPKCNGSRRQAGTSEA